MDRSCHCPEVYIEADLDFNLTLAEAVPNPIFLSLIDSMLDLLRAQRELQKADSNASAAQPMFLKAGVTQ